jgi:prepilin peptidase CpaA
VTYAYAAAILVALLASASDLRSRRVPNALTFPAMLAGIVYHVIMNGYGGAAIGAAGVLAGIALFFPLFALGGLGAGDVKLLGALGAWLGAKLIIYVAFYASLAGGVLAVIVIVRHGYARDAARNLWLLLTHWRVVGLRPMPSLTLSSARGPRLPYALPIAAGVLMTVWLC